MEKPTYSRTMFCEKCFKAGLPRVGTLIVLMGGESCKPYIISAKSPKGRIDHPELYLGFTPHLITEIASSHDKKLVSYEASCGVNGCDTKITPVGSKFNAQTTLSKTGKMYRKEWNQMILNADLGYHW